MMKSSRRVIKKYNLLVLLNEWVKKKTQIHGFCSQELKKTTEMESISMGSPVSMIPMNRYLAM